MSIEDIEKLKARVGKDPNSRLFLPLAEEYRKAGMLDEAISVLLKGLERHPDYNSARVALGKIYLEKKMIEEARKELEKVISVIPDNLFVHKKLAEIYRDTGEVDRALSEYKTVLKINPLDEEARTFIESIETLPENIFEVGSAISEAEEMKEPFTAHEIPESVPEEVRESEAQLIEEEIAQDMGIALEIKEESISEDLQFDSILSEEIKADTIPSEEQGPDLSGADGFVANGEYFKALDLYEALLRSYPNDKKILQRIAELKSLLKLLGKDREIIEKLEAFLEGIRRRTNEFFGRP